MISFRISCIIILFPALMHGQEFHALYDSPIQQFSDEISAQTMAQECMDTMWYNFTMGDGEIQRWPTFLDSLNRCCIAGKTLDPIFQKKVSALLNFYKGSALLKKDAHYSKWYYENALELFTTLNDSLMIGWTHAGFCSTASSLGDSLLFTLHNHIAMSMVHCNTDPVKTFYFLQAVGTACFDFYQTAQLVTNDFKMLELCEKYGPMNGRLPKHLALDNISGDYVMNGDVENAERYAREAIASAILEKANPAEHYRRLAWCFILKNNYSDALQLYQEAERKGAYSSNVLLTADNLESQAECYRNLGRPDTALLLSRKATQLVSTTLDPRYGTLVLSELACDELALRLYDQALSHAKQSYKASVSASDLRQIVTNASLLADIYKAKGDLKHSDEYRVISYQKKSFLDHQANDRKLAFAEFNRDNEIKKTQRDAEIQANMAQQRNIRYALLAGLVIFAVLTYLMYNRYQYKNRTTKELEIKNAEIEVARLRAEHERSRAEASEAIKSRFLANMSHEIRTPLHGIAGYTDLLLDTSISDKQRQWLTSIYQSTGRLGDVVNDILDFSKLEAAKVTLRKVNFSPTKIVTDVAGALDVQAKAKSIEFTKSIDDHIPSYVMGDPTRLFQILMNLCGNAIKFTEKGIVNLKIQNVDVYANRSTLKFVVSDTGIGIAADKLSTIFDSFQQAEEDTSARFGGTGLGLTIARELIHLFGGKLEVESEINKGSVFSFEVSFPIAAKDDDELIFQKHEGIFYSQPISILMADDNSMNLEIATEAIKRHFEHAFIVEAKNGKEVIEKLHEQIFDIILMDMQMPEMTGIETARYIRSHFEGAARNIPIMALTASTTPDEIQNAIASGMNKHLGKPFKPFELAKEIVELLGLQPDSNSYSRDTGIAPFTSIDKNMDNQDLRFLRDFCNHDENLVQHFLRKFQSQLPFELEQLQKLIEHQDRNGIYLAAHSLKPQLEFVGLTEATEIAASIEKGARNGMSFVELQKKLEQLK